MLAAIEGGGTKFLCAVGDGPDAVAEAVRIETTTPDETLGRVAAFLERHSVDAVGLAMFGPVDLRTGRTLETPKPGWAGVPVRARVAEAARGAPVTLDTDVNAAALAEQRLGAGEGEDPILYLTVGTGIGGGVVVGGAPLHGLLHPEIGHLSVPLIDGDDFPGTCPFHGRCLEGMASGTALSARLGQPAETAPADHPAFDRAARYIGAGLATVTLVLSPRRIVVGGGVTKHHDLLPAVRQSLADHLAGYLPALPSVVAPKLPDPGLAGAFLLALDPRPPVC